jgi:hypothetical protein
MPGFYHLPSWRIEFSRSFRWVKLRSFYTILNDLSVVDFDNSSNLSEARKQLMDALSSKVPFCMSNDNRFPENDIYVCVDKPQMFAQVAEVIRCLRPLTKC